jgi:hypothetical protein
MGPMPITYTIDPKKKLVLTRIWGAATESDVAEHNRSLRIDPQFDPHYRQLADITGITELLVSAKVVQETAHDQYFAPGVRRAFVASDDAVFGMARMFALHAEGMGQTIQVFRERAAAEAWLGL